MLSGKQFRLTSGTLGIAHRTAIMVPAGEIVTVLSGPRPDAMRLVDVKWGDRKLVMFAEDIQERGEEVRSHGMG